MKARLDLTVTFTAALVFCLLSHSGSAEAYDLHAVKGIEAFSGSKEATETLARNGFVVSDPTFKQIFEPYIKSPQVKEPSEKHHFLHPFLKQDVISMPCGVGGDERRQRFTPSVLQSQRLLRFSKRLWALAREQKIKNLRSCSCEHCSAVGMGALDHAPVHRSAAA